MSNEHPDLPRTDRVAVLKLQIPTEVTDEQAAAAILETIGEQLDSWIVTDVTVGPA